ncbi:MAG: integrin alpha [Candidatus Hermodarchaeota archaeon]
MMIKWLRKYIAILELISVIVVLIGLVIVGKTILLSLPTKLPIDPSEGDSVLIEEDTYNVPYFSLNLQWGMDTDLSAANASFIGEDAFDHSGYSVAGAGDVNADGFDDLLIGAYTDDDGGDNAGQTYLILGRSTVEWQMDLDLSAANASFIGEDATDASGVSVAGAGDVNADGFDDFLIGAYENNDGGSNAGQTYLILGRADVSLWNGSSPLDLSYANASFIGENADDRSGVSVAGAGDVNADGFDDFLIGASLDDDGGSNAGQTYLILGRPTAEWQMDLDLSAANASFIGEDTEDRSGESVAGAGDVNADGFDDLLIGAHQDDDGGSNAGQTYLILGRATAEWQMDLDLSAANASFIGEDSEDHSGRSVAGAGDVNTDGFDDLLIGAHQDDDGGSNAGQTYLILGRPTAEWQMDLDLSTANASFIGEDSEDHSGRSVAGAGDVNTDGFDDFLIGAPQDEDGAIFAGQTYMILGRPTAEWQMDLDLSTANAFFIGENSGDHSGRSVAGVGDVNADGFDDLLIGAYLNDDGGANAGQTYLILEKDVPPTIIITNPTALTINPSSVTISYSISEYVTSLVIYLDGLANTTALPSGSVILNLSEGIHNLTIVAVDHSNYVGKTTVIFTVDTIPPIINIYTPTPTLHTTNTISIHLYGDAEEFWYYIAGVDNNNQTWTSIVSRTLADGTYTLHAYGADAVGNVAHTSVTFTIDTTETTMTTTTEKKNGIISGWDFVLLLLSLTIILPLRHYKKKL